MNSENGSRPAEFHLRRGTSNDMRTIKRLIRKARINPFSLKWRRFTLAVDKDGTIIGCGQIKRHGSLLELASLAVEKKWRQKGVARAIIENIISTSKKNLWLVCSSTKVQFYNRFDFEEVRGSRVHSSYFRRTMVIASVVRLFNRKADYPTVMFRHQRQP
jgi:N-acetylglutamate synthase-like GNAT family acetyltransferase